MTHHPHQLVRVHDGKGMNVLDSRFGRLPVTADDGTLPGIITKNDSTRLMVDMVESEAARA